MFTSFAKLTVFAIFAVTLISSGHSAPVEKNDQQQQPLVPPYGDEPPKINSRDFWTYPHQDEPVHVKTEDQPQDTDEGDDNVSDDGTNEVQDGGGNESNSSDEPSRRSDESPSTKAHVIVKRNKRPIRYRNKSYLNNRQIVRED